jgi:hypothetical protein
MLIEYERTVFGQSLDGSVFKERLEPQCQLCRVLPRKNKNLAGFFVDCNSGVGVVVDSTETGGLCLIHLYTSYDIQ